MCKFVSMIVSKGKKVFYLDYSNSHGDIEDKFGLKDGKDFSNFQKIEVVPKVAGKYTRNAADWVLNIDDERKMEWWDSDCKKLAWDKWKEIVATQLIISGENKIVNAGFYLAYGSSTVEASGSAIVKAFDSVTVEAHDSATVKASMAAVVIYPESKKIEIAVDFKVVKRKK